MSSISCLSSHTIFSSTNHGCNPGCTLSRAWRLQVSAWRQQIHTARGDASGALTQSRTAQGHQLQLAGLRVAWQSAKDGELTKNNCDLPSKW